jgi:hypothetical protein
VIAASMNPETSEKRFRDEVKKKRFAAMMISNFL